MKKVCFASKKGGVSKTTSATITGLKLSKENKVLFIDLDSQNALSSFFFDDYSKIEHKTIYEVVKDEKPLTEAIHIINENIHVVPAKLEVEEFGYFQKPGKIIFRVYS